MINWLARIDIEDVKDRREKKSFDSILLQAAFKVWFKWKTQSSGSWSLTSAMPWLGFLDCLPKIIQQHILSILSLPVKNVTKSWKFLISSSMGRWERLCWQDMGVPWWHKIPRARGSYRATQGKIHLAGNPSELQPVDVLTELLPAGTSALQQASNTISFTI